MYNTLVYKSPFFIFFILKTSFVNVFTNNMQIRKLKLQKEEEMETFQMGEITEKN